MISFIVPAHNEQALLGRTLQAIHRSAPAVGCPYEIIVVDDASTDATVEVARRHQATVLSVNHRQIAATRNSGGKAARGEYLFFVDADTTCNVRAVTSAIRHLDRGAVGGGAPTWVNPDESMPLYMRLFAPLAVILPKLSGFTGGAFMFCTRKAFQATGGFNERLFWAEECVFALALKRQGRFVVLWERVATSGRRFRRTSGMQLLLGGLRSIISPRKMFTQRSFVEKVWYDSDRRQDDTMPNSVAVKIGNAITLAVVFVMITGPLWHFVPRSLTPWGSLLGQVRLVIGVFLSHLGLLLWPIGTLLLLNLLRQKRWTGMVQSLTLIGLCAWQAWSSTRAVIWMWTGFCHWLSASVLELAGN